MKYRSNNFLAFDVFYDCQMSMIIVEIIESFMTKDTTEFIFESTILILVGDVCVHEVNLDVYDILFVFCL